MSIAIRYTETIKQVLGIILIPILFMGILLGVLFSINLDGLSVGMEFAIIMTGVIIMMSVRVYTIFKIMMEKGEAFFDASGLHFRLNRSTFLYPHKNFDIPFTQLDNASINEEPGKSHFISLQIKHPSKSILIFPVDYANDTPLIEFYKALKLELRKIDGTESAEKKEGVKSKSFYSSAGIRTLGWLALMIALIPTIIKIMDPESLSGWKLFVVYVYTLPFCYAVFRPGKDK
jgi:hypothetical protein